LLAYNIAQEAVKHGAGFILTDNSLARQGLMTARRLAPCVLFLEDLDEQGSKGRYGLNELLNTISGVESKADLPVITIVSTNFLGRIDPAFLRPDRFDAIIEMELPDPLTIHKLVDVFCGNLRGEWGERGWTELIQALQGTTPAIIAEVIDRGKISAIVENRLICLDELHKHILAMKPQIDASKPKFNDETPEKRFANDLHRISMYGA
jgi:transitional endoplasmic reticulum ATPase